MKKVLYFEGAGSNNVEGINDVENCRIRTAFTNNEGKKIYLEILSGCGANIGKGFIDSCHYITSDPKEDDCNNHRLSCERKIHIKYTREDILNFVNKYCNCDFDEVKTLNSLSGYEVFNNIKDKDNKFNNYNYGDEFEYNYELHQKRLNKAKEIDNKLKKDFNSKYSVCSIYCSSENNNKIHVHIYASDEKMNEAGYKERNFDIVC